MENAKKPSVKRIVTWIVAVIVAIIALVLLFNQAGLRRWKKNLQSSMQNGIRREIRVYNINGEEMLKFRAKMDFTYDAQNNMLEYIDADTGKKFNIFLGQTATMVIEEID